MYDELYYLGLCHDDSLGRKIGNSIGLTVPTDTCARLGIRPGQMLTLIEGEFRIARSNPECERQPVLADDVLQSESAVLQVLAGFLNDGVTKVSHWERGPRRPSRR